jgi:ATP-dependent exoDNAse (exonuclease V) beta subunit
LRFNEVTLALVDGLRNSSLRLGSLAFRLDGGIEHILLDEFQDTSLTQWRALEPMACRITSGSSKTRRTFFCVGDVKQAIYAWRGGLSRILETLPNSLGELEAVQLAKSFRSAQPVIDVVNAVFSKLGTLTEPQKCVDAFTAWGTRFEPHTTARRDAPGYVCLATGPAQEVDEPLSDVRGRHCEYVAKQIKKVMPGLSVGVLCRGNETVARMIYELRRLDIKASEEGGWPLDDSPAVEVILSLFTLADHPCHSVAWFHLQNSPLEPRLKEFSGPDCLSKHLRGRILALGYGPFTHFWAKELAPACDRRDLLRLQQLIEMAYGYQSRSTLRADSFVNWVRAKKQDDPTPADVRVLTIHSAKGLEFDAVFLPELDISLVGRIPPRFVVDRDPDTLNIDLVCRYASEAIQDLLAPEAR